MQKIDVLLVMAYYLGNLSAIGNWLRGVSYGYEEMSLLC